ncbi:DUF3348 domain-containing protein [Aquincola sp. J276]|uniref:DUF3348 domain-containing protein n=1 Tax=Aquincola sp. J276 TaxID=2898432 RepID=UPI00215160B5|nr:DUF3348 domain-containing protein [Aquincola sp. J276]
MAHAPRRMDVTGSALVRLLGRLAEAGAPASNQVFPERLSQWLGWADAISLHAALGGAGVPAAATPGPAAPSPVVRALADESRRLHASLRQAIDTPPAGDAADDAGEPAAVPDFAPLRRLYRSRQQAMEAAIGPLRARLRQALAAQSAAGARLAEVDAVMTQVLAPQERRLLATVPGLLEPRLRRLAASQADAGPAAWRPLFRQELQAVLRAELDIRFQPVLGLLAALGVKQAFEHD